MQKQVPGHQEAQMSGRPQPLRMLFLCTGNTARSQMAEAVLNRKGAGRFEAHSAGSRPADRVHPLALWALRESGLEKHARAIGQAGTSADDVSGRVS